MDHNAFFPSRPSLTLDGREEPNLSSGITSLLVCETTEGLYRCEMTLGNWGSTGESSDFLYFDRDLLDFGKLVSVSMGVGAAKATIFAGRIMGIEAAFPRQRPPELTLLLEDRFQDLRMTRRTRTFEDVSDDDVFQQIAAQHSLQIETDVEGPTYRVLAQLNQSDLAFLRERARAIDAELWFADDKLFVQSRAKRNSNRLTLTYGRKLHEFSVLADLAHQRTTLSVSGWDVAGKEAITAESAESALQSELNGLQSGRAVLQQALGDRAEQIVHLAPFTRNEAQSLADAHYRTLARRFVTGSAIAEGNAHLRVGTHVTLDGIGALFNGEYYVCEVRHTFNGADGFKTNFQVERMGIGR